MKPEFWLSTDISLCVYAPSPPLKNSQGEEGGGIRTQAKQIWDLNSTSTLKRQVMAWNMKWVHKHIYRIHKFSFINWINRVDWGLSADILDWLVFILPAEPFFCLLDFTVLRKTLHESSKIFIEHSQHVVWKQFQTQALWLCTCYSRLGYDHRFLSYFEKIAHMSVV